jgi:hypothetical protein
MISPPTPVNNSMCEVKTLCLCYVMLVSLSKARDIYHIWQGGGATA